MKKLLVTLVALLLVTSASFASVSFLTANSVGVGKWAVLGMYATNHDGNVANTLGMPGGGASDGANPEALSSNSLGVRCEYGVMKDLDVVVAYSMDTLANLGQMDWKQDSASTMGLGVKYTLSLGLPVDSAVVFGYESSNVGVKLQAPSYVGGSGSISMTSLTLGGIVSKQMGMFVPYGGIFVKSLSEAYSKKIMGVDFGSIGGTGLGFNIGCAIGIAANQAILVEYNTENQAWTEAKKSGQKIEENAVNVSGISLGYAYMF
jgi:hypothetical protein